MGNVWVRAWSDCWKMPSTVLLLSYFHNEYQRLGEQPLIPTSPLSQSGNICFTEQIRLSPPCVCCVALQSPSLPGLLLTFFKGKCLCLHSCQSKTFVVKLLLRSQWHSVPASRLPLQELLASRSALQDALESWVLLQRFAVGVWFCSLSNPEVPPWNQSVLEMCSFGNEVVEQLFEDALCAS